jgi:hypothetical protein
MHINNIKKIIVILLVLMAYLLLFKKINLFMTEIAFSLIAPADHPNIKRKILSDKIYNYKIILENENKINILKENCMCKIKTLNYKNMKKFNKKILIKLTNNYTTPVLIKNVFSNEDLKQYNYKTFISLHGDIIVQAINNNFKKNNDDTKTLTFKDYIKAIENGEKLYLTVNNSIANIIDVNLLMTFYNNLFNIIGFKNIFIGNKDSYTHLHCELASSCGIQLNGIKKWYLIDPKYSEYLHSISDKENIFKTSAYGFNKNNTDISKIPHYEFTVEKGDFLFVPPWWWHETLNLTNENIMFSYRPTLFNSPYKTNFSYTLQSIKNSLIFNKILYPLIIKLKLYDPNEDTVVKSIAQLKNRIPNSIII